MSGGPEEDIDVLYLQDLKDYPTTASIDEELAEDGLLPEDHPLTCYARGLFQRIHRTGEPIVVYVTEEDRGVNAMATNDNRIILTRSLIEFCESDEELLYVLKHESRHIHKQHLEQKKDAKEDPGSTVISQALRSLGQNRIFEMGEADIEGLLELDDLGVNVDGAFTFIRRFNQRFPAATRSDHAHGSMEDRLFAFKAVLLARDLKNYREGAQTPKSDAVKDPELYKHTRGFPVSEKEIMTKPDVWALRETAINRLSAYELKVNRARLNRWIKTASESVARGKKEKPMRDFTKRLIDANLAYLSKATPLSERMQVKFIELTESRHGIPAKTVEATERLEAQLNFLRTNADEESTTDMPDWLVAVKNTNPLSWKKFIAHPTVQADLELITQGDLMTWGALFRPAKSRRTLALEIVEAEIDQDAKNVLALLWTGSWGNFEGKHLKKAQAQKRPESWTPDDVGLLHEILNFSIKEEAISKDCSYEQAYKNLENKVLKRRHIKPYSVNFMQCLEVTRFFFSGSTIDQLEKFQTRIFGEIEDSFERCCLLALCASAIQNAGIRAKAYQKQVAAQKAESKMRGERSVEASTISYELGLNEVYGVLETPEAVATGLVEGHAEDVVTQVSTFLERVTALEKEGCNDSAVQIGVGWLKSIYSTVLPKSFAEGMRLIATIADQTSSEEHGTLYAEQLTEAWFNKNKPRLSLADIEALDIPLIQRAGAGPAIQRQIRLQMASHPGGLVKDKSELRRLLGKVHELGEKTVLLTYTEGDFVSFYNALKVGTFDFSDLDDAMLALQIVPWAADPMEGYALESQVWRKILDDWETKSYSVGMILDRIPPGVHVPFEVMNSIMENHTETEEEMDRVSDYLESRVKDPLSVGKAVFVVDGISRLLGKKKFEYLCAMLRRKDDTELKQLLLDGSMVVLDEKANLDQILYGTRSLIKSELEISPDPILRKLYSLDETQKHLLVHLLLTGEKGVLNDPEEMEQVINLLFQEYVSSEDDDADDKNLVDDTREIIKTALKHARPEDAYLIVSGLLAKRILQVPYKDNWVKLEQVKEIEKKVKRRMEIYDLEEEAERTSIREGRELLVYGRYKNVEGFETERAAVKHLVQKPEVKRDNSKMDAVSLLLEIAQSLRSVGTRGLQSIDMYMDLPPKYQGLRSKIYSDMEAQAKGVAYDTIKKNVPPEQRRNLHMGKRLGGGAMVTVYPFASDTMEGVVKVLGPNVEAFTTTTIEILDKTFGELLARPGGERFRPIALLLEDIRWWVLSDMNLEASKDLDERFTEQNHGFPGEGELRIGVPQVLYRDKRCLVEKRVHGTTLDRLPLSEADKTANVDLIRFSVGSQVMQGIVHSDIHPGNMLKGDDGWLYWLDRTLLLEISDPEKMMLFNIHTAADENAKLDALVEGLLSLPENARIPIDTQTAIRSTKDRFKSGSFEDRAKGLIVALRLFPSFTITPKLTLVFKNMLGVEKISERMGVAKA